MYLAIGPIPFQWARDKVFSFYRELLQYDINRIYIGETTCPQRASLKTGDWYELASMISENGKQVILSTPSLNDSSAALALTADFCRQNEYSIETNDMAAVELSIQAQRPFHLGSSINVYNLATLKFLTEQGAAGWTAPVELSQSDLEPILLELQNSKTDLMTEVFCYGYLPLGYSARCYTARLRGLSREACQQSCFQAPDGQLIYNQENQPFLTINGPHLMSAAPLDIRNQLPEIEKTGIKGVRLNPVDNGFTSIVESTLKWLTDKQEIPQPRGKFCNGYWFGKSGIDQVTGSDSSRE